MSEIFFCSNRIVDAWNSLPNTVLFASSTSNFEMKLRDVNKLTIVEWFYSYLCIYFFGIVLYFYVYFICVFSSISVTVWPYLLIWNEMKWTFNRAHRLTFFPEFHADLCPVTKKCDFIVPVTKPCTFFAAILRSFGPVRQNFKNLAYEFGLNVFVQFYPDPLRFAGVIRKTPIQTHRPIYMTAYNKI